MIHDRIFQELVPGYNTAARDQMIRITCATMAGGPVCSESIRRVARNPGNLGGGLEYIRHPNRESAVPQGR